MTDKQIIIDGVDVSGCEFVFVGKDKKAKISCWCNKLNFICKDNPNCYYKQLDQLKAENEELKKQLTILDDETIVVEITENQFEEYQKLKQTLTEIKEIAKYELNNLTESAINGGRYVEILQKISEVLDE